MSVILREFKEIVSDRCKNSSATQIVEYLYSSGVIDEKIMLKYVIRHEYYKRIKEGNQSCFSIKLDLAVQYDVTDTVVKNIIYNNTSINS